MVTEIDQEFTTEDLIAELQEYWDEDRDPGGVTTKEFAEAEGCTTETARGRLNALLKTKLERRKARVKGHKVWVYYKK